MQVLVRPELPTASVGSSQATTAAVDNSAPLATRPQSTYKSGNVVQTNGATSDALHTGGCVADYKLRWLLRAIARLGIRVLYFDCCKLRCPSGAHQDQHVGRLDNICRKLARWRYYHKWTVFG